MFEFVLLPLSLLMKPHDFLTVQLAQLHLLLLETLIEQQVELLTLVVRRFQELFGLAFVRRSQ